MKKLLLLLALLLLPASASAQCNGVFGASQACGSVAGGFPGPIAFSSITGNGITALTGDGTASGPGSVTFTLATVNANVGSFGSTTQCVSVTVNGKGLITAVSAATCAPAFTAVTGQATLAQLPQLTANSIYINATGSAGQPLSTAVPSCANDGAHGLVYVNGSGLACATLTTGGTVTSVTCGTGLSGGTFSVTGTCAINESTASNILGADVALNNTANYFPGPSMAQGTSGTWWVSGTVTVTDTAGAAQFQCKLWDSTTVISSGDTSIGAANALGSISLHGFLATPAANILISCKDVTSTSGKIIFNQTGNSKDSSIWGHRIQ